MRPVKTPVTTQMNLLFCNSEPMTLPQDKQRELAMALADLLLNATTAEKAVEPELCRYQGVIFEFIGVLHPPARRPSSRRRRIQ